MGRPSLYNPELHIPMGKTLYRMGLTDEEVAEEFGVSVYTILKWAERYPEFCKIRRNGKALPDAQVVDSLFKKAMGYEYEEEVWELEQPKVQIDSKTGKIVRGRGKPKNARLVKTKVIKKKMPPDTLAIIFWLKNRQPEYWRDRHYLEGDSGKLATIVVPTNDQIQQLIDAKMGGGNNGNGKGKTGGNGSHPAIKDVTDTGTD